MYQNYPLALSFHSLIKQPLIPYSRNIQETLPFLLCDFYCSFTVPMLPCIHHSSSFLKLTGRDRSWTGDYAACGRCHLAHAARFALAPRLLQRYDRWVSRTNYAGLLVYYIQELRSLSSRRTNFTSSHSISISCNSFSREAHIDDCMYNCTCIFDL